MEPKWIPRWWLLSTSCLQLNAILWPLCGCYQLSRLRNFCVKRWCFSVWEKSSATPSWSTTLNIDKWGSISSGPPSERAKNTSIENAAKKISLQGVSIKSALNSIFLFRHFCLHILKSPVVNKVIVTRNPTKRLSMFMFDAVNWKIRMNF